MRCPACGYEMAPFDKICARCQGKGLRESAPPPQPAPEPPPPAQPPVSPPVAAPPSTNPTAWGAPPPTPGWPPSTAPAAPVSNDNPSFGFALMGFVIPELGFWLWRSNRAKFPEKAQSAYRGAAWGMGIRLVLAVVIIALVAVAAKRIANVIPDVSGDGAGVPGMSITVSPFQSVDDQAPLTSSIFPVN